MRRLLVVLLVGLSACASVPGNNDVRTRAASWQGAPAAELIAILGEPRVSESGNLTWRFPGPEEPQARNRQHRSADSGSLSVLTGCASCSMADSGGSVVTPGMHFSGSAFSTTRPRYCTYLAVVENETVSKLVTLGNSRTRCLFSELPLRPDR